MNVFGKIYYPEHFISNKLKTLPKYEEELKAVFEKDLSKLNMS